MSRDKQQVRPPNYYIKKRLLNNKPAMAGMGFIIIAHLIAILGYLIMPDDTPNANDGAVEIKKKTPGYQTTMLRIRKNQKVENVNFLQEMLTGQESKYTITPIKTYKIIDSLFVEVVLEGGAGRTTEMYNLVDVVKPLYFDVSSKLDTVTRSKFKVVRDSVYYIDLNEEIQSTTKAQLIAEFKENHIENRTYYLGTDMMGRDMTSRLLFGTRISLSIGFISVVISLLVGVTLGALAGFFGGWVDNFIMWFMTVVWSIPGIMLVIAISLALQSKGVWVAFVAVGLTMWVEVARVVRGQIIAIREKLYVEAARALGIKSFRIIFIHILPNIMGPLIVIATANFAAAILIEAGLSFLGLGVQPPMPSWGMMVQEGYRLMSSTNSWHLIVFPSLCISLLVLSFNLFGNGLRDAYDPKTIIK